MWVRYQADRAPGGLPPPRFSIFLMPGEFPASRQVLARNPRLYLETFAPDYVMIAEPDDPLLAQARDLLVRETAQVLRLSPLAVDDGRTTTLLFRHDGDGFDDPFWLRILRFRCMGPTIEVYRLPLSGSDQPR